MTVLELISLLKQAEDKSVQVVGFEDHNIKTIELVDLNISGEVQLNLVDTDKGVINKTLEKSRC